MTDCVPYAIHVVTGLPLDRVLIMAGEVGHDPETGMSPVAGWSLLKNVGCTVTAMKAPVGDHSLSRVLKTLDNDKAYILSTKDHWIAVVRGKVHDKAKTHGKTAVTHLFEVLSVPEFKIEEPRKPQPLTVSDMAKRFGEASRQGMGHRKVRLRFERGTIAIGSGHTVDVVEMTPGFDWSSSTLFLETSEPLGVADDKLAKLKHDLSKSGDLIYRLNSIIDDSSRSAEQKVELIERWLKKHLERPAR